MSVVSSYDLVKETSKDETCVTTWVYLESVEGGEECFILARYGTRVVTSVCIERGAEDEVASLVTVRYIVGKFGTSRSDKTAHSVDTISVEWDRFGANKSCKSESKDSDSVTSVVSR